MALFEKKRMNITKKLKGRLTLYTFKVNKKAQRKIDIKKTKKFVLSLFYKHHLLTKI
jgi:hypothetical protein